MSLFNNKLQKVQMAMLGQDVQDKFNSTDAQLAQNAKNFESVSSDESAQLGAELLDSTGWTSTGWTGDFNTGFTHTVGQTSPLRRTLPATGQNFYQVTLTLSNTGKQNGGNGTSDFSVSIGNSDTFVTYQGGWDSFTYIYGIQSVSDGDLVITPDTNYNGTVTNISVKQIVGSTNPTLKIADSTNANSFEIRPTNASLLNVFIGKDTGKKNTAGHENVGIGSNNMAGNTTGFWNTAVGKDALSSNTVGSRNVAIGYLALSKNISGHRNIAVGPFALRDNTKGANNIALGADSLWENVSGNYNVGIGLASLSSINTGDNNTAIGQATLTNIEGGSSNIAIGDNAGYGVANAVINNNILLGHSAGFGLNTGADYNIIIGSSAGVSLTTGASNILIGYNVQAPTPTTSSALNIGNALYGTLANKFIGIGDIPNNDSDTPYGSGTSIKLQVGNATKFGVMDLKKGTNANDDTVGIVGFVNKNNLDTSGGTRKPIAYIAAATVTANTNTNGDSGGNLKFFAKAESGGLNEVMRVTSNMRVGIGVTGPTAGLHIRAGSSAANSAPLKLTSGTLNITPEAGAIEFDGTNLYFTRNDGTRHQLQVVS